MPWQLVRQSLPLGLADAVVVVDGAGAGDSQVGAGPGRVAGFPAEAERGLQSAAHRRLTVQALVVRDLRCPALVRVQGQERELVRDRMLVAGTSAREIDRRCSREPDRTSERVPDRVRRHCPAINREPDREPDRDRELALGKALPIDPVGRRSITTATRSTSTVITGWLLITAALASHSSQLGCRDWEPETLACQIKELDCRTAWRIGPSHCKIGRAV